MKDINNLKFLYKYFSWLFLLLCICSNRKITPSEYVEYINTLSKKNKIVVERGDFKVNILYFPSDYFAAKELNSNSDLKFDNSCYFVLTVRANEDANSLLLQDGISQVGDQINYNTFNKYNDVYIITNEDTISLGNYQYERGWADIAMDTFIFSFNVNEKKLNLNSSFLVIRNLHPHIGTIEIKLSKLLYKTRKNKV